MKTAPAREAPGDQAAEGERVTTTSADMAPADEPVGDETEKADPEGALASWQRSPERIAARMRALRWAVVSVTLFTGAYFLALLGERWVTDPGPRYLLAGLAGVGALFAYIQALTALSSARAKFQEEQERKASREVRAALKDLEDSVELPALLQLNRRQIEEYHVLTKGQASSAYVASQIAMSAGLVVLVGGSAVAVALQDPGSKVAAGALTAIGSLLAGYVGRTFIRTYERTLVQLNHFFEQPLLNSYLLTAERLVGAMSPENRDQMYARLIERSLGALQRSPSEEIAPPPS